MKGICMKNRETRCLIAMDAGGTKTETVLFTADGTVMRRKLTNGVAPKLAAASS